jgi:hypothetical protein
MNEIGWIFHSQGSPKDNKNHLAQAWRTELKMKFKHANKAENNKA